MDDNDIGVERRHYPRVPLTRTVSFSVTMRMEIESLKKTPVADLRTPSYEINATIDLRQSRFAAPVRYDLSATMTPRASEEQEQTATTKNLGQGGLCIVTAFGLQEHQVVRIGLPVPESDVTTPTLAEVRWLEPEGAAVRAGLKYLL